MSTQPPPRDRPPGHTRTPSGYTAEALAAMDPDEFEARSLSAVEAGQLPLRAQQRLADLRDHEAWTSDLSVSEFDVLGSVGFRPVGQVMGTSVYQIAWTGMAFCGGGGRWGGGFSAAPGHATPLISSLYDARYRALTRMQAEATALGADGVVGVELSISHFRGAANALEFHAIGTAVRADGPVHPPSPFLSDLSGQDFVKLLLSGWVPTGIAMGISVVVRHDDWNTRVQAGAWVNTEIGGYTELIQVSRHTAREALRTDVRRLGGEGVVVRDMSLRVHEQECRAFVGQDNGRDHVAEVTVLGTAITRFSKTAVHAGPRTLPILRVGPARSTGGIT
jgi:uncharacterized protein YbjQ (UPF0145 family)